MTISKIQVKVEKGRLCFNFARSYNPDRCEIGNFCFPLNNLSLREWISLKFIQYMTISKIQDEFEKGGYA